MCRQVWKERGPVGEQQDKVQGRGGGKAEAERWDQGRNSRNQDACYHANEGYPRVMLFTLIGPD